MKIVKCLSPHLTGWCNYKADWEKSIKALRYSCLRIIGKNIGRKTRRQKYVFTINSKIIDLGMNNWRTRKLYPTLPLGPHYKWHRKIYNSPFFFYIYLFRSPKKKPKGRKVKRIWEKSDSNELIYKRIKFSWETFYVAAKIRQLW